MRKRPKVAARKPRLARPARRSRGALYAAGLLAVALAALLVPWFAAGWADVRAQQRDVGAEPTRIAERKGAELAMELRGELTRLIGREVERPYYHYQNLMHDPRSGANFGVTPSPLATGTGDALVLGYFQLDDTGRVTTPTINDDIPRMSEQRRLAENSRFRDEVLRNMSRALTPRVSTRVLVAEANRPELQQPNAPITEPPQPQYEYVYPPPAGNTNVAVAQQEKAREGSAATPPPNTESTAVAISEDFVRNIPHARSNPVTSNPQGEQRAQVIRIDPSSYDQNNYSNEVYWTQNSLPPPQQQRARGRNSVQQRANPPSNPGPSSGVQPRANPSSGVQQRVTPQSRTPRRGDSQAVDPGISSSLPSRSSLGNAEQGVAIDSTRHTNVEQARSPSPSVPRSTPQPSSRMPQQASDAMPQQAANPPPQPSPPQAANPSPQQHIPQAAEQPSGRSVTSVAAAAAARAAEEAKRTGATDTTPAQTNPQVADANPTTGNTNPSMTNRAGTTNANPSTTTNRAGTTNAAPDTNATNRAGTTNAAPGTNPPTTNRAGTTSPTQTSTSPGAPGNNPSTTGTPPAAPRAATPAPRPVLRVVKPPPPPPKKAEEPKPPPEPILITISPFEWRTYTFEGQPAIVAVRNVDTPDGELAQGFVIDRTQLTSWLATHAGDAVAALRYTPPPTPAGATDATSKAVTSAATEIAPGWYLDVAANPRALLQASTEASDVARGFIFKFVAVGIIAMLAAAFVVFLVANAEKLARERSQFAAAAAHELRTPLAGLQLYGDMLADGLGDPLKLRDYARRMSEEASRLGRVVSNVLGFSQLERGNLSVEARDGDLGVALCELADRATPALDRAGAVLDLDVPPDLRGRFDRDALARIVGNLLDNAEKYGREAEDRTITLAAREVDDGVEVVVSDRGPGVTPATRAKLFRAFSRGVTSDGPAGLGLGLALSQSLARAMNGELSYRPSTEGASFVLRLDKATT